MNIAIVGCGFWATYQVAGWRELPGVTVVAVCDADAAKARTLAETFGVAGVYTDARVMLDAERIDALDVITSPNTHAGLVLLAAEHGVPVITQKPMANDLETCRQMVDACERADVPLFVHENFRWQTPIRALKAVLDSGEIGTPFKGRIYFCSGFPVFDNQPFLAEIEQFIISDVGSHTFDMARFLFGEPARLFCRTQRINPRIRGEDVANTLIDMVSGLTCYVEMSYASVLESDAFPETLISVEGSAGSVELRKGFDLRITTRSGTRVEYARPPLYAWANPDYAVVHASIVDCNRNILSGLRHEGPAETTGADNLQTVRMVHAAYESARTGEVILLKG
ncbi:Gfo/Idh/MocA family protein [Spirosoma montaniterrae]|uniref:Oxidoreductase n=1 Tax=Spirosoma montaniterrae TaxID=1178516 RepID=A0A1P9WV40_9BACT|nr:Gfo/Idh/MocA family oxidoreductase [Spirosoma montaniterrae]AQG79244.1 oxidoreductase [Spirosoma montaniterrae]